MTGLDRIGWDDPDRAEEALYRLARDLGAAPIVPEREVGVARLRRGRVELSTSETMLLRALACGLTLGEAADALGKSVETLRTQSRSARCKLRAKNATHACCEAVRQGLIP